MKILLPLLLLLSGSLFPLPAGRRDTPGPGAGGLRLYVFDTGRITAFDASVLSPGVDSGRTITLGNPSFLIVHPEGTLFWDTGLADSLTARPEGVREEFALMAHQQSLLGQLQALGVDPGAVDYLALSHLHTDHAGNANYFKNATMLIQQPEWAAASGPYPGKYLFAPQLYREVKKRRVLHGDHDVFGDGTVVIKSAPGHSPGHQTLFVRLPRTGPVLLSGDLYHHARNREHRRMPVFTFDFVQSRASMERLEHFLQQRQARLWIQHDPAFADTVRYAPHAYL